MHLLNILNALVSDTSQRISVLPRPTVEKGLKIPGVEESYPLSPMQHGMLFDSLSAQEPGVDVEQIVIRCREDLAPNTLKESWEKIVRLHPIMRTGFRWEGIDKPLQDVYEDVTLSWHLQDWRDRTVEEQDARLKAYLAADRQRDFAMNEPPLMRFALFEIGDAEWLFVWTFHHSLLDGRSFLVVLRDVFGIYDAVCEGQELEIPSSRPYRDYINWLRKQDKSTSEPFWRDMLKGFASPTQMRIEEQSGQAITKGEKHGEEEIKLSESLTSSLKAGAGQYGVTINTLVQGAWALLLSRYSGEEDVVYGATRAGRHWSPKGTEDMVGIFINTLPVRVRVPSDARMGQWLRELRNQHIAVREHEHIPLIDVQGWSEVPRGVPLFETIVVFENFLLDSALKAQGGTWVNRDLTLFEQTSFPLTLSGYLESELILRIEYDRSRYGKSTISEMLQHLRTLLEGMVEQPERTLGSIPILTEEERSQVLVDWNATEAQYPKDKGIHQLFEAQVARTPDATAVVHNDMELSYDELNQRANQLAHYLKRLGVKSDVPVGLFVERSFEMCVGVLGILKAGGAYLPLDPAYPIDRLTFMLNDSRAPVIVTHKRVVESLPEYESQVVVIDEDQELIGHESKENPSAQSPDNLVYVMYTSGSTGQPKGVLVPHRGVVNHAVAVSRQYGIIPEDRVLQFFSINFDGSVEELFCAWAQGAALVLRSADMLASTTGFLDWIEQYGITVIDLPTAYWHEIVYGLSISERSLPVDLRVVIVGGEKASASTYSTWSKLTKGRTRWFNTYGPTECAVVSTVYEPDASFESEGTGPDLPIGRPIANTQIYVLDKNLQPVPVGVPGEMFIGGAGVARGYLNRPELTAERFIKNPFSDSPGERLYKTGDLVRYLPDGNIDFIGRTDFQLKFRGFRVEPGEIESILEQHPSVREAVVMLREDVPGRKFLAAYRTAKEGTSSSTADLRQFLKDKLPEYMVPAAFVLMDSFPLSPNGKVDRRALPVPDVTGIESDESYVAPRNKTENTLALIWAEVLGVKQVGINDNFFELGGHSLLTLQVLDRAHREGLELTPQQLFKHQTIAELVSALEPASALEAEPTSWSSLVSLQPDGSRLPFFLVHTTPGDILGYGNLIHHLGPDQPCYGFQSLGLYQPEQAHTRIEDMAAYYVDLLLAFQPKGPYILGGWCYGGIVSVEMAQQLVAQGHDIGLLALIDTWAPRPDLGHYRYYLNRVGCFLRMGVHRWICYARAKVERKIRRRTQTTSDVLAVDLEHGHLANRKHVLKINMQAVKEYRSKPYPGRITLFNLEDPGDGIVPDPKSGWSTLAAEIEMHPISSSHRDMLQEPQVKVLAGQIKECIDQIAG
ncbi:MAG: amino acid adenylation domain-containing protein [Thermodesulfobacteriota bacterium]|nr:amino acid adenylation domain-containing protein [Thermodesulfobacteriota bacterium]